MQPTYKVVQIQGMSAYSVRSVGPDYCVCIGIGYRYGYRGGPEPFHISELYYTNVCNLDLGQKITNSNW